MTSGLRLRLFLRGSCELRTIQLVVVTDFADKRFVLILLLNDADWPKEGLKPSTNTIKNPLSIRNLISSSTRTSPQDHFNWLKLSRGCPAELRFPSATRIRAQPQRLQNYS